MGESVPTAPRRAGYWRRLLGRHAGIIAFFVIGGISLITLRYVIIPAVLRLPPEIHDFLLKKLLEAAIGLSLLTGVAALCFKDVPDGFAAIVSWLGLGLDETLPRMKGPFFVVPLLQRVELCDTREQDLELRCFCQTRDDVLVRARVRVRWAVDVWQIQQVKALLTLQPVQILEARISEWLAPEVGRRTRQELPAALGQLSASLSHYLRLNPYAAEESGIHVTWAFIAGFDGPTVRTTEDN